MKEPPKTIDPRTAVRKLTFDALHEYWLDGMLADNWACPFVTPPWLRTWWEVFGEAYEPLLLLVEQDRQPIGCAPLMIQGQTASCMGSADLCDHADLPVVPGYEDQFSRALVNILRNSGVRRLVFDAVRPDSYILGHLLPTARALGCRVRFKRRRGAVNMLLPDTWDDYLQMIAPKQRHEIRRKLRRVAKKGMLQWDIPIDHAEILTGMDYFVHFFKQRGPAKKAFMTPARERFFRLLAERLDQAGMLKLYCFRIDHLMAAVVFCIEAGATTYLYNNGFDPRFNTVSIGVVSKVMTIKASIAGKKSVYDFLNGNEPYKYRLGGTEVPLFSCTIEW